MATINLTNAVYYSAGKSGASAVVGYESRTNRVARYAFVTPSTGATSVSLNFTGTWPGNGAVPSLRFYIGTDADSHVNAGADSTFTGALKMQTDGITWTAAADILLLPDKTYYLFVFPATTDFGWYQWAGTSTLTTSGGSYSVPTLSASTVAMGGSVTINTNRNSTAFTHTITYKFGDTTGTIAKGVTDSCKWTPSLELARQIPKAPAGVATIYCATYSGDTQIGNTQAVTITLTVPDTVVPTASMSWADSSGAYDKLGAYVQNVTKLAVEVTGTGAYGSTITGAAVTLDGKPYSGAAIPNAGDLTLVVTVTDSRGRPGSADGVLTVAPYTAPQLDLTAHRCTQGGTADDTGEYALVTITGSTTQVNGRNAAALSFTYGSTTKSIAVSVGSFTHTEIIPAPSTATLALSAKLSDKLLSAERSMTLSVGYATMDFLKGGRGIAFGATATIEGFTCAMDARFLGSDLPLADYVVEQGVRGNWRYRKWNSGMAECWGSAVFSFETTDGYSSIMHFPAIFVGVPVITYSHGGANAFIQSCLANVAVDHFQLRCTGTTGYHTNIPCYAHLMGTWK